jgi:hypothetical protein
MIKKTTGLLVTQKKPNKLLVWLTKLIQYPGTEETGGLTVDPLSSYHSQTIEPQTLRERQNH